MNRATFPSGDDSDSAPGLETAPRRATIVDVAAHAGVSVASASKVLRDAYGVSADMKTRVRESMQELKYRPSASARGMRGRTFTVGVTVPDIDNQFVALLVEGISDVLDESGYEVLIGAGGNAQASQSKMIDAMLDRQMDGLVLFSPYASREKLNEVAASVPTVVVSRHGPSTQFDTVVGDDLKGARLVVDHLVELGHERIAFISHDDGQQSDSQSPQQVRARGYRQAMTAHGLEREIDVIDAAWNHSGGRQAGLELLRRPRVPTAVFAGADVAAIGLMSVLWEAGMVIPNDISVVGYDNISLASLQPISLTSVDQSARELGRLSARSLLDRISGRTEAQQIVTNPFLEPRASSARLSAR